MSALRPMDTAPRDGSEVMLLVRHANYAREPSARWQCEVRGRWTPHNGGGWTWWGLAGTVIAWRPKDITDPATIEGECAVHG